MKRRLMRGPSMVVRVVSEILKLPVEWANSRLVLVLDAAWDIAIVGAAAAALFLTGGDSPSLPLRLWMVVYAVQCLMHVVCVCVELRKRQRQRNLAIDDDVSDDSSSLIQDLETANTMLSFLWLIIGFYWIFVRGVPFELNYSMLCQLCIILWMLDLFPCIIAILFALDDRTGCFTQHIEIPSKYTFHRFGGEDSQAPCVGVMKECGTDSPRERRLNAQDAECCICLSTYEDGVKLRELSCGHHFHNMCVGKWLYINWTCPLCRHNISKLFSRQMVTSREFLPV